LVPPYKIFVCILIFASFLTAGAATLGRSEEPRKPDIVFAYSAKTFIDVDARDAMAALKIYTEEIGRQLGYSTGTYIYDNLETVIREVRNGGFDIIVLSALDFILIRNKIDLELAVGGLRGGKKSFKYLLLTHQNRGYAKIGDLKNKKLTMPKDDNMALLFLNTALLRQKYGEMKSFFSSIEEKNKTSQAVLAVFFGQADACIVTDVVLNTMVEMNPQLGRDLKVITSSQELTTSISVFRKTLNDDMKEKTLGVGRSLKESQRGKQVLLLFKIEDLVPLKDSDLASITDLTHEYERLKGHR
jgi:ABC-type phosphate/phosphonate transport system substrate-binding protein